MKLTIEFYGRLKAEFSSIPIEVDFENMSHQTTIEQIYLDLCKQHNCEPAIKIIKPILNDTFADWHELIKANDVIGFFPPASGG
jgi:molybdopterin converting factor small subunit